MIINSSGNVGIGSTININKLDVGGNINLQGGNGVNLTFNNGDANITVNYNNADGVVGRNMAFKTYKAGVGNTEKMRITRDGNVGIGTTSPDYKLDVDGTFGVSDLPFNTDSVSVLVADETIGAELITNGDFDTNTDWTLTANVAISGGKLNFTNATTNTHFANQVISAPVGSVYKITLEVSNLGSGESIKIRFPFQDTSINANGTYTIVGEGTTANAFRITPASATATFSIDNVSVKQVISASNQIQKRELGTGAFANIGDYLPLAGGTMTGTAGVLMPDDFNLKIGTGSDLKIFHNATDSFIINETGNLKITQGADGGDIIFESDNGSGGTTPYFKLWGAIESLAVYKDMLFVNDGDGGKLKFGASQDLQIYHDGSNSYVKDSGTGNLWIQGSTQVNIGGANGEIGVQYVENAGVGLRHNNVTKLTTESTGVAVVGNITVDSALLSNQENTDIDTGAEVVAQVAYATYTAAFFDFVVKKGTNVRSGTVYACHDGDTTPLVEFTETSTQDLGDTSDVVLSVDISGTQMRLLATVASDDWSVKSLIRAI